jgi:hypothetical protein
MSQSLSKVPVATSVGNKPQIFVRFPLTDG